MKFLFVLIARSWLLIIAAFNLQACLCGLETVEESKADAGLDAGLDAGAADAAIIPSDPPRDGGCFSQPRGFGSVVIVQGLAGRYGQVDYAIGGTWGGSFNYGGVSAGTNDELWARDVPPGLTQTNLTLETAPDRVDAGVDFLATNEGLSPYVNFAIIPGVWCEFGAGTGRFHFTTFVVNELGADPTRVAEGTFAFQCPDAGIDVHGCFHFE